MTRDEYEQKLNKMSLEQLQAEAKRLGAEDLTSDPAQAFDRDSLVGSIYMRLDQLESKDKLAERLCRLMRFVELNAPDVVMASSHKVLVISMIENEPKDIIDVLKNLPKLYENFTKEN